MNEIQMMLQDISSEMIDVYSGTGAIEEWASLLRWSHFKNKPESFVVVLKKVGEKYVGAVFVPEEKKDEQTE